MLRLVLFSFLLCLFSLSAQDMANALFDRGEYQQALAQYEKQLASAKPEEAFRLFYRVQESRALLFRYAESAEALYKAEAPSSELDRARFYLLRAEISREFLKQYGRSAPSDLKAGASEVTQWTPAQWRKQIEADYFALLPLKKTLLETPLTNEAYFLVVAETDTERVPTLWDFTVLRWTEYLTQESADKTRPRAATWLQKGFTPQWEPTTPAYLLAASLWKDAAEATSLAPHRTAREYWKFQWVYPEWARDETEFALKQLLPLFDAFQKPRTRALVGEQAAALLSGMKRYSEALALCRKVEKLQTSDRCHETIQEIESPRLNITALPSAPLASKQVKIRARNLAALYVRLFPTTRKQLEDFQSHSPQSDWSELRLLTKKAAEFFLKRKPVHETQVSIRPTIAHDWTEANAELPPALSAGLYAIFISDDPGFGETARFLRGTVLNVTDLFLFADRPIDQKKHRNRLALRVLSGETGEPTSKASVQIKVGSGKKRTLENGLTDSQGAAEFSLLANQVDPLVEKNGSYAYLPNPIWLSLSDRRDELVLHIDTDRAIYRPGQKVLARITALVKEDKGYRAARAAEVNLQALDGNGRSFFTQRIEFNSAGSAAISIPLPQKGILGTFSLMASGREAGTNTRGNGYTSLQVEEYVRPDFEVQLLAPSQTWKLGKAARVEGRVQYYFGGALSSAPVRYDIYQEPLFVPYWHFQNWPSDASTQRQLVSSGEARTDNKGSFSFTFVPAPLGAAPEMPSRFTVEVKATGSSGRTLETKRTYLVSKEAFSFDWKPSLGFTSDSEKPSFALQTVSLENTLIDTKGSYSLYALDASMLFDKTQEYDGAALWSALQKLESGKRLVSAKFETRKGRAELSFAPLKPGAYRLTAEARDADGSLVTSHREFLVQGRELTLPAVTVAEKNSYELGETARVLLGSSDLRGKMVVEIWQGENRLKAHVVPAGVQIYSFAILREHRGDVFVRWYGVYHHRLRFGETRVGVPWSDRKLTLAVSAPTRAKPGEQVDWTLALKDSKSTPVSAEAFLRVSDRSLDAYNQHASPWVESLYTSHAPPAAQNRSFALLPFAWLEENTAVTLRPAYEQSLPLPHLRSSQTRFGYQTKMMLGEAPFGATGGGKMRAMAPVAASLEQNSATSTTLANAPPVRKEFQETAFFGPQIPIEKGRGKVRFRFSDATTSWTVVGYALDKEYRWASVQTTVATSLDFFVEPQTPRFVREGDRTSLRVTVHNASDRPLSGQANLQVYFTPSGTALFKPLSLKQRFTVAPKGIQTLVLPLDIPQGSGEIRFKVEAEAGKWRDAAERVFFWLPARTRSVSSQVISMEGGKKSTLRLETLPDDAQVESVTLQIDPQITSAIFQALPSLTRSSHEDALSLADRFVPLAVVDKAFETIPGLAHALESVPARKTQTAAWDANDPRSLVQWEETPWLSTAQGGGQAELSFWNAAQIHNLSAQTWSKLARLQKPSGAFAWFNDGPDDAWVTIYVLNQLAEARRNAVVFDDSVPGKALSYLQKNHSTWLLADPAQLSQAVLASHALTLLFPESAWKNIVDKTLEFAQLHRDALTPLGKAYLASVAFRAGKKELGDNYLALAMDGMRENEWGAYWAPEKISWLWYNDSVDKHAYILRLLTENKPQDLRAAGLVKWLLFNRKATQWTSVRNSSSAILALLEYQKKHQSLFVADSFQWKWEGRSHEKSLSGTQVLREPLRWNALQPKSRAARSVTLQKSGPDPAFASLTAVYTTQTGAPSQSGPLALKTQIYKVESEKSGGSRLVELAAKASVAVGTEVEIQLTAQASTPVEYLQLRLGRAAGLEPREMLSEWKWERLPYFREIRDTADSFFIPQLPMGEVGFKARFFATTPGEYHFGPAVLQSIYAPDLTASSEAMTIRVTP